MPSRSPSQRRLSRLIDTHTQQRQSLVAQLVRLLLGVWGSADWRDDDLVNTTATKTALLVMAGLAKMRQLEQSYTRAVFTEFGIPSPPQRGIEDVYPRADATPQEVYWRTAKQYRWAIAEGKTPQEAVEEAVDRLERTVETDFTLAERDESFRIYSDVDPRFVTGWRRIVRPELSKSGPCGMCVVAADRWYRQGDLQEIHNGCVCTKLPITAEFDPGVRLNREDLDRIYGAANQADESGSTMMEDLKRTRVKIGDHGEIGPVLVREGHHFRDAAEVGVPGYKAPTPEENRAKLVKMRDSVQGTIERLERRYDSPDLADNPLRVYRALKESREQLAALEKRLTAP